MTEGQERLGTPGLSWAVTAGAWLLAPVLNGSNSGRDGDGSFLPGWAFPVAAALFGLSVVCTVAWGGRLGRREATAVVRRSVVVLAWTLGLWYLVYLASVLLPDTGDGADPTALLILFVVFPCLNYAALVTALGAGWFLGRLTAQRPLVGASGARRDA